MSCDVSVSVVRKEDFCPMGKFFLGGNGTKNAMFDVEMTEIELGYIVKSFESAQATIDFLAQYDDDFYSDSSINELNEYLYDPNCDNFVYWLVMEY